MSRVRTTDFEERDYYPTPRRSAPEGLDEVDYRRRTVTISPPAREESRTPAFLREDGRRTEAGPMVLRQRQVETIDRHRPRSPSPVTRVREERIIRRPRSVSPPSSHEHENERSRTRVFERERVREPSQPPKRAPSPARVVRYVERPKKSPSPPPPPPPAVEERERIRTRIIERERAPSPPPAPKPSPPPAPPQTIRGPTIEREVITHYRDIDHGMIKARPPTPPPPPPKPRAPSRVRERETDIDISLSKNKTEVDISRTTRTRSQSRERRSHFHDDEIVLRREPEAPRRRAQSAAPLPTPSAVDEEGDYLTSKIDSRGKMGEAWGGATKDWAIVDVPPGTERIRMDGIGGGSTDTHWTRYSGVRRSKFIPEREGAPAPAPALPPPKEPTPPPTRDRLSVSVYDREREIDIERTRERSRPPAPSPAPPKDMWTEITKDLVVREAIEEVGYEYEETKEFFYIMDYLKYLQDDVLHLVDISDEIRRARKQRARELEWEREYEEDWERTRHRHHGPRWDEITEREMVFDSRPPRGYLR
ncbi:uncharacterized protein NECHADRAFT_99337 [Fusarium vanettenii 77-13-4]|uniref:DUF8035 domain-containing protein n=1 Tax=Fusarium vanettenii (strain ATCC MYA-4622 / CBS 123669 / FGSC 9596 / NRRL 45880 / 77-13-4) TaxID=660122 RepID=C7Z537_FUSV7|nr:uncharacterized protein NECHADRAFT_99337 [Fusarium vanettenii 77-13-4]EEU41032.1 hypothetical protein NECHADRAFT_99337 [Fusarium vanettenii 77-13-4]